MLHRVRPNSASLTVPPGAMPAAGGPGRLGDRDRAADADAVRPRLDDVEAVVEHEVAELPLALDDLGAGDRQVDEAAEPPVRIRRVDPERRLDPLWPRVGESR